MRAAYTKDKIKVDIDHYIDGMEYFCPTCGKRLFVKHGEKKLPHFSHYPKETCIDYWKYDESLWANSMKKMFDVADIEKPITHNNETHRVDTLVKGKLAMMFNTGPVSAGDFWDKNYFILSNGLKVMWVLNFIELMGKGRIKQSYNKNVLFYKRPAKMFEDYTDNNKMWLVLELHDDSYDKDSSCFVVLHNVKETYTNGAIYVKRWLTRMQLIDYFNDIADGKDPEERYRIIEEQERAKREAELKTQQERIKAEAERRRQQEEEAEKQRKLEEQRREKERLESLQRLQGDTNNRIEAKRKGYGYAGEYEREGDLEDDTAYFSKDVIKSSNNNKNVLEMPETASSYQLAEMERLKDAVHTIVDLWNYYNPNEFLTVKSKDGRIFKITSDPVAQLQKYKRIYGYPLKTKDKKSCVIEDALEKIWIANFHS